MKLKRLLSAGLSIGLILTNIVPVIAEENNNIVIAGNEIYRESFDTDGSFASNTAYIKAKDGEREVLQFDRRGTADNMQSLFGADCADVIAEYDMRLTGATGATNNSVSLAMRAEETGGESVRFSYHDISTYDMQSGKFGGARVRDRLSVAYAGESDDVSHWNIGDMSGTLGIENTSARCFEKYYTFRAAIVGSTAYHQIISDAGELIGAVSADLSGYALPKHGKAFISAHNCAANIDEIRMYSAIRAAQISIEADNMELSEGETTGFNIRVCDAEGVWHSLDKTRNTDFEYSYDSEKLSVNAEEGTITALSSEGLTISLTAYDFYSNKELKNEFEFKAISDDDAVESAAEALMIDTGAISDGFELPGSGLYGTDIAWSSSSPALRISSGRVKIVPQESDTEVILTAVVSRAEASVKKEFFVTVKAEELPERDVILKGRQIFYENFDDENSVDADIMSAVDGGKIKLSEGALHIDSKGAVMPLAAFGPEISEGIVEYDAKQISCNANSNAQFSVGLMADGSSYRFAYTDISQYNPLTNRLDGSSSRDRLLLGYTPSSDNISNWTLYGAGRTPIGILKTSGRSFERFYKFSAAASGNTMQFAVSDNGKTLDLVSHYDKNLKFGTGRINFNMQSTEFLLDNISVYEAASVNRVKLVPAKSVIAPGETVPFEIVLSGEKKLDREYYNLIKFVCDDGVQIDVSAGTLTADSEGEFSVRITASDYLDETLRVSSTAIISASSYADKLDGVAEALDITDYVDYPDGITDSFELPDEFMDASIRWSADNSAISISGTKASVTRGEEKTSVILTAMITMGGISVSKSFNVSVERNYAADEAINLDHSSISLPERTKENIQLPSKGRYGSSIKWSSGNSRVITSGGEVKRQAADTTVRITAEFSIDGVKKTFYYNVIVEGTGSGTSGSNPSGSSGGGNVKGSGISASNVDNSVINKFTFSDIGDEFWAREAIYDLVSAGIIAKAESFRPNDKHA